MPPHWRKFKITKGSSISRFIADFSSRLRQLEAISTGSAGQGVWLGGLFQPEAYVTATRQTVAHQKGWSLEQLVLDVRLEEADGNEGFVIEGKLIGVLVSILSRKLILRSETRRRHLDRWTITARRWSPYRSGWLDSGLAKSRISQEAI